MVLAETVFQVNGMRKLLMGPTGVVTEQLMYGLALDFDSFYLT